MNVLNKLSDEKKEIIRDRVVHVCRVGSGSTDTCRLAFIVTCQRQSLRGRYFRSLLRVGEQYTQAKSGSGVN